jgi:hypothetical protein
VSVLVQRLERVRLRRPRAPRTWRRLRA